MKKAILLICFGNRNIDKYINRIKENLLKDFDDIEVFYSFVSKYFIFKYGFSILDTLNHIYEKGITEVIAQPLFTVDGKEFEKAKTILLENKDKFKSIRLGKPLLSSSEDIENIKNFIENNSKTNTLYICHGTEKETNQMYKQIFENIKDDIYFANLESNPYLEDTLIKIKNNNITEIDLKCFLLFKGKHIEKDILGEDEKSIKNRILKENISLNLDDSCLLDYDYIINMFKNHIKNSIKL